MKKILIVNDGFPPLSGGSAYTLSFMQAKGLTERGYDISVFTTTQDKQAPTGWHEYEGVRIYTAYTQYHERWWGYVGLYNPGVIREFKKEITRLRPDIVHFHNIHHYVSYHALVMAKRAGAKVFLTAHDVMSFAYIKLGHFININDKNIPASFNYKISWWQNLKLGGKRFNPIRNFVIRKYLAQADKIFAVSNALRDALMQNGINNVSVVHNGIDVVSFGAPFDESSFRKGLGLGSVPVVLYMGRLTPPKGSEILFEAMRIVKKTLPNVKLLAVGTPIDEWMKTILKRLNLSASVVILPAVLYEDVYKLYRVSSVVVVPSIIFDSFPTVNLEAMAAKKPVVATCFGGSREAVEDTVTGYIVNPLNIENFAQKILFLLQHPQEAKTMGEKGYERVQAHFTTGNMLDTYCAHY